MSANSSALRMALVLEEPFEQDARGAFHSDFSWLVFGAALLQQFSDGIVLCPLRKVETSTAKNHFEPKGFDIVGLPWYTSFASYYKSLAKNRGKLHSTIEQAVKDTDVVFVRAPSQVGTIALKYAKKHNKPLVVLYAGDVVKASEGLNKAAGAKRLVMGIAGALLQRQQIALAKASVMAVVYGEALKEVYGRYSPKVYLSKTATISAVSLTKRTDTCQGQTIRLLRVGSYLPNKNYELLLDALVIVRAKFPNVELRGIGQIRDEAYHTELKAKVADGVTLNPAIAFGEALFEEYRTADIQIISSNSEGIPRTILEGASFCLPLVSTNVGGIGQAVQDEENGLLVPPNDAPALANAIIRMIEDAPLRQRLIAEGFERAKQETIEALSAEMAGWIRDAVGQ